MAIQLETIRTKLLTALSLTSSPLTTADLWDRYLVSKGYTFGTVLDRQAAHAKASGKTLMAYQNGDIPSLGPNIAPSITDGSWTIGLAGASQDGSGLHFLNCNAGTISHAITTEDNVTYRITWTQNWTSGAFRWQVYGATTAHLGQTAQYNTSGTFTEDVITSAAGSLSLLIRANPSSGVAGSNTMDITSLTIQKVL